MENAVNVLTKTPSCKGWNVLRSDVFERKVKEMWSVLDLVKDENGCIRKDAYMVMNLKLAKALEDDYDEKSSLEAAHEDWERDSRGQGKMNYQLFFDSINELVTVWSDATNQSGSAPQGAPDEDMVHKHTQMLSTVVEAITVHEPLKPADLWWKETEKIKQVHWAKDLQCSTHMLSPKPEEDAEGTGIERRTTAIRAKSRKKFVADMSDPHYWPAGEQVEGVGGNWIKNRWVPWGAHGLDDEQTYMQWGGQPGARRMSRDGGEMGQDAKAATEEQYSQHSQEHHGAEKKAKSFSKRPQRRSSLPEGFEPELAREEGEQRERSHSRSTRSRSRQQEVPEESEKHMASNADVARRKCSAKQRKDRERSATVAMRHQKDDHGYEGPADSCGRPMKFGVDGVVLDPMMHEAAATGMLPPLGKTKGRRRRKSTSDLDPQKHPGVAVQRALSTYSGTLGAVGNLAFKWIALTSNRGSASLRTHARRACCGQTAVLEER